MATAVAVRAMPDALKTVVFRFDGRRMTSARAISLVAPFNRWDTSVHRLIRQPDGWWTISIILARGTYPYLFVVDGEPRNDLEDDGRAPCEWGGEYSVRTVH